ncbi:MAG TPA: hypothetical protein VMS81_00090, partial [Methanomicrobiales archaeon]|nr:hypothetical protein [Methanomicrobiales archaeon]
MHRKNVRGHGINRFFFQAFRNEQARQGRPIREIRGKFRESGEIELDPANPSGKGVVQEGDDRTIDE